MQYFAILDLMIFSAILGLFLFPFYHFWVQLILFSLMTMESVRQFIYFVTNSLLVRYKSISSLPNSLQMKWQFYLAATLEENISLNSKRRIFEVF